jgi:ribosomal protein S18 acetylase RimI-like enzyme
MEIQILPITREVLEGMHDVFSASAGYDVTMSYEFEHFESSNPQGWLIAQDSQQRNVGFIRHFFTAGSDWTLGELYLSNALENRKVWAETLLRKFSEIHSFPTKHRLRFDLGIHDRDLNEAIEASGFSEKKQLFHHFELNIPGEVRSAATIARTADPAQVATALSNLHPVSETEAMAWMKEDSLRILIHNEMVVAAAQIYDRADSVEINRIATHPQALRAGHSKKLMEAIFAEVQAAGKTHMFLKVEDTKKPAIALYKSCGFTEVPDKAQVWHSRWY